MSIGSGIEEPGGRPYAIPAGAADHPLGGLGFARWAFEVAEQERELGVFFETIVVCSVTGSTQAGLGAGFAALAGSGGRPRRVVGIDGSAKPAETRDQITRIARQTARLIGVEREVGDGEIELDERYHAGTGRVSVSFGRIAQNSCEPACTGRRRRVLRGSRQAGRGGERVSRYSLAGGR